MGNNGYAVIDLGSNSLRCLTGRWTGQWQFDRKKIETTRLGRYMDQTGRLDEEGVRCSLAALSVWQQELQDQTVYAVATSAVREAANGAEFMETLRQRFGWQARIISGQEEAALSFAGASALIGGDVQAGVIDIGGGSTEVACGRHGLVDWSHSYRLGAVRMALGNLVAPEDLASLEARCDAAWLPMARPAVLLGAGGTLTSLAAMDQEMTEYDPDRIQGYTVTIDRISWHMERLRAMTPEERRHVAGLQPKRSDIILSGLAIARSFLRHYGLTAIQASEGDLLEGFFQTIHK